MRRRERSDGVVKHYNEADTRAKLIDPKVKLAGWGEGQIEREHYFVKGRAVRTAGSTWSARNPAAANPAG